MGGSSPALPLLGSAPALCSCSCSHLQLRAALPEAGVALLAIKPETWDSGIQLSRFVPCNVGKPSKQPRMLVDAQRRSTTWNDQIATLLVAPTRLERNTRMKPTKKANSWGGGVGDGGWLRLAKASWSRQGGRKG